MIMKQITAPHPAKLWTGFRGLAASTAEPVRLGWNAIMLTVTECCSGDNT